MHICLRSATSGLTRQCQIQIVTNNATYTFSGNTGKKNRILRAPPLHGRQAVPRRVRDARYVLVGSRHGSHQSSVKQDDVFRIYVDFHAQGHCNICMSRARPL